MSSIADDTGALDQLPNRAPLPVDIVHALLQWARSGALRELPWRAPLGQPRDPYAVWISEIMLQQTQASSVVPYYGRWMARFPTVQHLAAASQDEVLKVWEGLGYYSRARNVHRAAKEVIGQYGGRLPEQRQALLSLPGIGRYTAGAILSIAFGQRAAALDGNVKRVLARVHDIEEQIGASATTARLWRLAEDLVDAADSGQAGTLNEALMDLGAQVCLPQVPRCPACPLGRLCQARRRGTQAQRPVIAPRRPLPHYDVTAAVIARDLPPGVPAQVLIAQRPAGGMLGGLWEFPGGKCHEGETLARCLQRELHEELGIDVAVEDAPIVAVRHAYTHFRITLHAFSCRLLAGKPQAIGVAAWRWVTVDQLSGYAFPVTDQKIIAVLRAGDL